MSTIDRRTRECERPGIPMTPMTDGRFARSFRRKAVAGTLLLGVGVAVGFGVRVGRGKSDVMESPESSARGRLLAVSPSGKSSAKADGPSKEVAETLAAFGGAPSIHDVLGAVGFVRYAKLSRFLATASADECAALYKALKDRDELSHHFMDMINLRWAEIDPMGAVTEGSSAAVWAWAKSDPEAAFAHALNENKWYASEVIRAVAQDNAANGEAMLREHPELGQSTVWEGIASSLSETNPRAAAAYALAHGIDLDGILKRWTETDPEGALEFALAQTDPRDRGKALDEVLGKLADKDPSRALEIVAELPPGGMRHELQEALLKRAAQADPAMATEWARAIPREAERMNALRMIATEICQRDPDRALGLFIETVSINRTNDPFATFGHHEPLVRALVATRPEETLAAMGGMDGTDRAMRQMTEIWVQNDPAQASTWISDQPEGAGRSAMVRGLVTGMLRDGNPDFASAAIWALSLPSARQNEAGNIRGDTLGEVFSAWLQRDRSAALEAMSHEGMPPQVRALYEQEASRTQ